MPDRTNDMARSPFAKNRDFYLSCACTAAEGLLGGSNFMLIWLVMHQLFSGAFELAPLLHIKCGTRRCVRRTPCDLSLRVRARTGGRRARQP